MKSSPFRIQPRSSTIPVGDEDCGIADFIKMGDLTVGERSQLDQMQVDSTETWSMIQELATKIHQTEGISEEMAFNVVSSTDWVESQEAKIEKAKKDEKPSAEIEALEAELKKFQQIKAKYIWDILKMSRVLQLGNKQQENTIATIFINSRTRPERTVAPDKGNQIIALVTSYLTKAGVDKSIVFGLKEALIEELETWTEGDTKGLTTEFIQHVLTFYKAEAKIEDDDEGGEEKDPNESSPPQPDEGDTTTSPPQTGEKSSGESENTGRTTKGSTKKTLATAQ